MCEKLVRSDLINRDIDTVIEVKTVCWVRKQCGKGKILGVKVAILSDPDQLERPTEQLQ